MKQQDAVSLIIKEIKMYYNPDNVADASGLAHCTVKRWLRGVNKPSVRSLYRVADVLGYRVTLTLRRK